METHSEYTQEYISLVARIDNPHRLNGRHFLLSLSLEFPPEIGFACIYKCRIELHPVTMIYRFIHYLL